jgi:hypothetical protein
VRLWSLHPRYLDAQGLVALWREALLARAVLRGETLGYRHHPQLERFRRHAAPRSAICAYLAEVRAEALRRGYAFDPRKVGPQRKVEPLLVTRGQLAYEWDRLLSKLAERNPEQYRRWRAVRRPACHPLMRCCAGDIEAWERRPP